MSTPTDQNLISPEQLAQAMARPKTSPEGRGRISPNRAMGESETRGFPIDFDNHLFKDILSGKENPLASGSISSDKEALSSSEYFNRKQHLMMQHSDKEVADPKVIVQKLLAGEQLSAIEHRHAVGSFMWMDELAPGLSVELDEEGNQSGNDPREINEFRWNLALAQRFVFGDAPNYGYEVDTFTGQLMLPYDKCTFILPRFGGGVFVALVEQLRDNQILISGVYKGRGEEARWKLCNMKYRVHLNDGVIKQFKVGEKDSIKLQPTKERTALENLFIKATRAILAFVDGLDKKVAVTTKPTLIAPTGGETKLEDGFTIVYMKGVIIQANPPLGGTHASPREHDRQAHWRTRGGKKHRVKATVVNPGTVGRIYKEYHIKT